MTKDEDAERTPYRPRESALLAKLDTLCREAEDMMALVQDDGRISGPAEKAEILRKLHRVKALAREAEQLLSPSGAYSIVLGEERVDDISGREK